MPASHNCVSVFDEGTGGDDQALWAMALRRYGLMLMGESEHSPDETLPAGRWPLAARLLMPACFQALVVLVLLGSASASGPAWCIAAAVGRTSLERQDAQDVQ